MRTQGYPTEQTIFKPRPSNGWLWVSALGLLCLVFCAGTVMAVISAGASIASTLFPAAITGGLALVFFLIALWFPSMRYEFVGDTLRLTYGPVLRYSIPIQRIQSIRSRDFQFSLVSSFRFPGLALFHVPYPAIGTVKMCATASSQRILLIETDTEKYGLTPLDEEGFVNELRRRMEA